MSDRFTIDHIDIPERRKPEAKNSDLIERLRADKMERVAELCDEAADEIERLRAALEHIATKPPPDDAYELRALARQALEDSDE